MSTQADEKRRFYSQPETARAYDGQRFGGPGGARVNARELSIVGSLLPAHGRVLDLGCGTGRLSAHLQNLGYSVVGLDTSAEMLRVARSRTDVPAVNGNGFALPFRAGAFDAVVALRVAFHFRELAPLLSSARDVLAPGGVLVVDTSSWSPRAHVALGSRSWGGKVWIHRPAQVRRVAAELGYAVEAEAPCFLFTPVLYRRIPLPCAVALERLERIVPPSLLCRSFWRLHLLK